MSSNRHFAAVACAAACLWATQATATITVTPQGNSGQGTVNSGLSLTINPTTSGSSGDLIVATFSDVADAAQPTGVASTIPGCTTMTQLAHVTATPQSSAIYTCTATGAYSSSNTVTATWAGSGHKLGVLSSTSGVGTHDVSGNASGTSNSVVFTYPTLAQPIAAVFVAYLIADPAANYTPDASLVQIDYAFDVGNSAGYVLILSYIPTSAITSTTVTSAIQFSKSWQALYDSFYGASAPTCATRMTLTGAGC